MKVIKRDGKRELFDCTQTRKQTIPATEGLINTSVEELELNAEVSFKDGMTTEGIADIYIYSALNLIDVDRPNYTYVAARLALYKYYHKLKRHYFGTKISGDVYKAITFRKYAETNASMLPWARNKDFLAKIDLDVIDTMIKGDNDKNFNYLGITSFIERYVLRDSKDKPFELPQHLFMSLACFLTQNEDKPMFWIEKFYNVISEFEAMMATPTTSNGRSNSSNCFSCASGSTPDDVEAIFDVYKAQALGSKEGTGFGWDWSRVRANGGVIDGHIGAAGGVIPFLKIENDVSIAIDQLGVRPGAINVTLETWHLDILDFIDLKKNGGEDKRRAKELFTTASCSDMFMSRVVANKEYTLFDPHDTPELTEIYGDEFTNKYLEYEEKLVCEPEAFTNKPVKINAKTVWKKIQTMFFATGMPFIIFKDNANNALKPIKEFGLIRNPNLCVEYLSPIKDTEIPLCNLASYNMVKVNTEEDMRRVIPIVTRMLDNVIDVTNYPIPNSEATQKLRRSIGLGLVGEAEFIANKGIMYGSQEHLEFIDEHYALFAEISDQASRDLAKERGAWREGEEFRNYHRRCLAPTSSISILLDTTNTFEAVFDKVWTEENKLGMFKQTAPRLNASNYNEYVTAYDVNQHDAVRATAARQKFIDMGISHVTYFIPDVVNGKFVFDTYVLAWMLGMKTIYYTRTKTLKQLKESKSNKTGVACFGCGG